MKTIVAAVSAVFVLLVTHGAAHGHGAGFERESDAEAVVLRFGYSIGEPMSDTDVVVTAPDGRVWQRGRTDREGRFSLLPIVEGDWIALADDGLGHEVRAVITVGEAGVQVTASAQTVRVPPLLMLGLLLASVIINIGLWLRLRRR